MVAAAKAYADRQDLEVDNNIDNFILMAEAKINRLLKTREQSSRAFAPTREAEEYYSLPPDFRGMRDIQVNTDLPTTDHSVYNFEYLSPKVFNSKRGTTFCGTYYYTVIANQIQVFPILETGLALEIVYFQKVPNLNEIEDSNWLSTEHPDIYLSGITAEIETFVKNYEVAGLWYDRMKLAIDELDNLDISERWSGGTMTVRLG